MPCEAASPCRPLRQACGGSYPPCPSPRVLFPPWRRLSSPADLPALSPIARPACPARPVCPDVLRHPCPVRDIPAVVPVAAAAVARRAARAGLVRDGHGHGPAASHALRQGPMPWRGRPVPCPLGRVLPRARLSDSPGRPWPVWRRAAVFSRPRSGPLPCPGAGGGSRAGRLPAGG